MGDTKAPPRLRSRQCMFVLYPESQQVAIDYCKQNLPCAWALHDKDVYSQAAFDAYVKKHEGTLPDWMPGDLKKPHVHFVCSFPNARYFSGIAKEIGVEVNVIRKVNNLYKAYVYLWHLLKTLRVLQSTFIFIPSSSPVTRQKPPWKKRKKSR